MISKYSLQETSLQKSTIDFRYIKFSRWTFHLSSKTFKFASLCVSKLLCLGLRFRHKPGPHAAMLHTCDGAFIRGCDASESMCCDRKLNMLNILVPILEYLGYLSPNGFHYCDEDSLSCHVMWVSIISVK